jgi:hypothetical protein
MEMRFVRKNHILPLPRRPFDVFFCKYYSTLTVTLSEPFLLGSTVLENTPFTERFLKSINIDIEILLTNLRFIIKLSNFVLAGKVFNNPVKDIPR